MARYSSYRAQTSFLLRVQSFGAWKSLWHSSSVISAAETCLQIQQTPKGSVPGLGEPIPKEAELSKMAPCFRDSGSTCSPNPLPEVQGGPYSQSLTKARNGAKCERETSLGSLGWSSSSTPAIFVLFSFLKQSELEIPPCSSVCPLPAQVRVGILGRVCVSLPLHHRGEQ